MSFPGTMESIGAVLETSQQTAMVSGWVDNSGGKPTFHTFKVDFTGTHEGNQITVTLHWLLGITYTLHGTLTLHVLQLEIPQADGSSRFEVSDSGLGTKSVRGATGEGVRIGATWYRDGVMQ